MYLSTLIFSELLQALCASVTHNKYKFDSLLYLQQLCSDHKGETPLDIQLEGEFEAGEDEHIDLKQPRGQQQQTLRF